MATMTDIVNGALKRLRVLNPRFSPDGSASREGLIALNDMMHSWKGAGVDIRHVTLQSGEEFPLDDEHIQGTKALLAIRMADDYGLDVSGGILRDADEGWRSLLRDYIKPAKVAESSPGLVRLTTNRWGRG